MINDNKLTLNLFWYNPKIITVSASNEAVYIL